jgi:hypothetical protein
VPAYSAVIRRCSMRFCRTGTNLVGLDTLQGPHERRGRFTPRHNVALHVRLMSF